MINRRLKEGKIYIPKDEKLRIKIKSIVKYIYTFSSTLFIISFSASIFVLFFIL